MSAKELKPEVIALAAALTNKMSFDKANAAVVVEKDAYTSTLPEHLTAEVVKQVSDHNVTFVAAGAKAFGDMAQAAMVEDKKIDRLTATFPMTGKDKTEMSYDRTVTTPNLAVPGESITKFGVLKAKVTFAADNNAGQYKAVRSQLKELAEAALGG